MIKKKYLLFLLLLIPSLAAADQFKINPITGRMDIAGLTSISSTTLGASTYFILNQNELQPNSTFYVSSGTVSGQLSVINNATLPGIVVSETTGQTGKMTEWKDDSLTTRLAIDANQAITDPSSANQIQLRSRPNMGSFGGDFTTELKRDGTNNAGNGTVLKFTDGATSARIQWMARGFTQNVNDLEFWSGSGSTIGMVMSMPATGGIYLYNPVTNTQDMSLMKVPAQTVALGAGIPTPQGAYVFDAVTLAATSPIDLYEASSLLINSAPLQGTNVTLTNRYGALLRSGSAGEIPLAIRSTTTQTADLTQWQVGSSTPVSISSVGYVSISTAIILSGSYGTSGQFLKSNGPGAAVSWGTASGGGASSLAVAEDGVQKTSPTVGINFGYGLNVGVDASTANVSLAPDATGYIQNRDTLQSGATFYVSSGTVDGQLVVGTISVRSGLFQTRGSNVIQLKSPFDGLGNSVIGNGAGAGLTSGFNNTLIGENAGAALNNDEENTFIGKDAGEAMTAGTGNTFIGHLSGETANQVNESVGIGVSAGRSLSSGGSRNTFIGFNAGYGTTSGADNVFIGNIAGQGSGSNPNTTGSGNVFIGYDSGQYESTQQIRAVAIGYQAKSNCINSGQDCMVLGNADTVGYTVGIGTNAPTQKLHIKRGNLLVDTTNQVMLGDADGSNFVTFRSSDSIAYNQRYVVPDSTGTADQVLAIKQIHSDRVDLYWKTDTSGGGGATIWAQDGGADVVQTSTFDFTGAQFIVTNNGGEALVALDPSSVTLLGASIALGTETTGIYVASINATAPITVTANGTAGATPTIALTQNAGTDVTADLEEEAHVSEHQDGGADELLVTGLSGLLADSQKITITTGTTDIITSTRIAFVAGSNVTISAAQHTSSGTVTISASGGSADNLGNHTATTTLNMAGFPIVNISSIGVTGGGTPYIDSGTQTAIGLLVNGNTWYINGTSITYAGTGASLGTNILVSSFPNVNGNVGSFTNANITVNAQGFVTAASNGTGGSGVSTGTAIMFAATETARVTNTTTNSSVLGAGIGRKIVLGGSQIPGGSIWVVVSGTMSTRTPSPGAVEIAYTINGTTFATTASFTPSAGLSTSWKSFMHLTFRSTGTAGTMVGNGYFEYQDPLGVGGDVYISKGMMSTGTFIVNTTVDQTLDLRVVWGSAFAANNITASVVTFDNFGGSTTTYVLSGGGTPGGSDTYVQYNDGASFGGDANFTFDETNDDLTVSTVSVTYIDGSTATLRQIRWADGTVQVSSPTGGAGGGGDVYLASTQTFSGGNTFTSSTTFRSTVTIRLGDSSPQFLAQQSSFTISNISTMSFNTGSRLVIPQGTSTATYGNEGSIFWKTDDDSLWIGTGTISKPIGGNMNLQVFTATGTYTPHANMVKAYVIATGGGAGSPSCTPTDSSTGGGGAGGTAIKMFTRDELLPSVSVGIGAAAEIGVRGSSTTFGSFLVGGFGDVGISTTGTTVGQSGIGGAGGVATGGDINIQGGDGGSSIQFSTTLGVGGAGGVSYWGGGPRGGLNNNDGRAGRAYGTGASGCHAPTATDRNGNTGATGVVQILEFLN